jgi:hypothetical protein
MFHGHLDDFQKLPLGGRPNTKPLGDHALWTRTNVDLFLFYHVWGPAWIEIHWSSIWLRSRSHMTSHYTWGSVTTLHDCGGVLRRGPLDTFFWDVTNSWSQLLAHVWSDPQCPGSFWAYTVGREPSDSKSSRPVTCWHPLPVWLSFIWCGTFFP